LIPNHAWQWTDYKIIFFVRVCECVSVSVSVSVDNHAQSRQMRCSLSVLAPLFLCTKFGKSIHHYWCRSRSNLPRHKKVYCICAATSFQSFFANFLFRLRHFTNVRELWIPYH